MKYLLYSIVGGVHVALIGGVLLFQGCGTTRGPVSLPEPAPMPPALSEDEIPSPVRPEETYKPVSIEEAVAAARPDPVTPPAPAPVTVGEGATYVVAKGDTLSQIARRFKVRMTDLMVLNNISNPDRIRLGQKLKLPETADATPQALTEKPRVAEPPAVAGEGEYIVAPGDCLSVIAQRAGTTTKALQEVNNLQNDRIYVGQKLKLPAGVRTPVAPAPAPAMPRPAAQVQDPAPNAVPEPMLSLEPLAPEPMPAPARTTYKVQVGDDILTVASEHNVSIADLRRINQLTSDTLIPGQVLVIPVAP